MHRLVAETGVLDLNSTYAYLLMATDFADTSIVAERDGELCGLITGYHPPLRPEVLFIWQVAVARAARATGLAATMLDTLARRIREDRHGHPLTVEATVAPGNTASRALFGAFARRHGVHITEHRRFVAAHLSADQSHEDEPILRIGPLITPLASEIPWKGPMPISTLPTPLSDSNRPAAESELPEVYSSVESEVRSYCRNWPTTMEVAQGSWLTDTAGRRYLDFFAGAGALNYGHNNPTLKEALLDYLTNDRIVHSLDMATSAKTQFLETFERLILQPRNLDYKVQFPGPTGANAVEAALKLARKVTGRESIINFTNAFHGMTLGALSVTGNSMKRAGAGIPLVHSTPMPYDNYFGGATEDFQWFERVLDDSGGGLNHPAAVIVETVQGEGGLNVARADWLRALAELCRRRDILLIVDDVQMGCGRTGRFFSFEEAGIVPDIVTLSKSISGYGLPMALTLFRRELDVWAPGEHNGTFRGHNPAFVTATRALETFWQTTAFADKTAANGREINARLERIAAAHDGIGARGRGMAQGLKFVDASLAAKVCRAAFDRGVLMETSGPSDEVVKLLPPLTTTEADLNAGIDVLAEAVATALS